MMLVILAVLATSLGIILERMYFLHRKGTGNSDDLAAQTAKSIVADDFQTALDNLDENGGPTQRLMRRAVEEAWEGGSVGGVVELTSRPSRQDRWHTILDASFSFPKMERKQKCGIWSARSDWYPMDPDPLLEL